MLKKAFAIFIGVIMMTCTQCMAACNTASENSDFQISNGVLRKYKGTSINVVIPKNVTEIGETAFLGKDIVSVSYEDGCQLKKIGKEAFMGCHNLTTVFLPDSVEEWDNGAFSRCNLLDRIDIPASLTTIGNEVFFKCSSLISMDLSDCNRLKSIGEAAFLGTTALKGILFPDGLISIGERAFLRSSVEEISIPGSVLNLGKKVFCNSKIKNLTIEANIKEIPEDFCADCIELESVTLPQSIEIFRGFYNCTSLKSLVLPENVKEISGIGECVSMETLILKSVSPPKLNCHLSNCKNLKQIIVPTQSVIDYKVSDDWVNYSSLIFPEE